jgi:hypothetical protein
MLSSGGDRIFEALWSMPRISQLTQELDDRCVKVSCSRHEGWKQLNVVRSCSEAEIDTTLTANVGGASGMTEHQEDATQP